MQLPNTHKIKIANNKGEGKETFLQLDEKKKPTFQKAICYEIRISFDSPFHLSGYGLFDYARGQHWKLKIEAG